MESYHYGQFGPEHLQAIQEGLKLYNAEKFWECHEELEDHWLGDTADNARYVYWAVIQVATSLFHYLDGNLAGARGMHDKALRKLDECEKRKVETELLFKELNWIKFKKLVRSVPKESELSDFDELYSFKF